MTGDQKIIECLSCLRKFSELDVERYLFFPVTRICFNCYYKMQAAKFSITCFGKRSKSKNKLGYEPLCIECRTLCKDRFICAGFVSGRLIQLKEEFSVVATVVKSPYRSGSTIDIAFKMCKLGTTKEELRVLAKKHRINSGRLFRVLRRSKQWKWVEEGDKLWIK